MESELDRTKELKIWPEYFKAVSEDIKTFEVRKNDRGFRAGDTLVLKEWIPAENRYTGREIRRKISYIINGTGEFGILVGFCVMGLYPAIQGIEEDIESIERENKPELMTVSEHKERERQEMVEVRDRYAAAALTGILSCFKEYQGAPKNAGRVKMSFEIADMMMAERGEEAKT